VGKGTFKGLWLPIWGVDIIYFVVSKSRPITLAICCCWNLPTVIFINF